jgi:tRNA nucleotidyltransferase (CCA-adding enzyme)
MVAPSVFRLVPALWHEALSILSAAAQQIMVRAPKRFLDQVLWPEFSELDQALQAYLHQVTLRVIREEVYADASEAQEVSEALPPN